MGNELRTLREDEIEIMVKAPAMVTMLVAGADGVIDMDEVNEAIAFVQKTKEAENQYLFEFYNETAMYFEDFLGNYIKDLPASLEIREVAVTSYLRQLNGILPKIEIEVAISYYDFLLGLAKAVAEASGGIFGFKKVSKEEAVAMKLEMVKNPKNFRYT